MAVVSYQDMNFLLGIVRNVHGSASSLLPLHSLYPILLDRGSCLTGRWAARSPVSLCRRHSKLLCSGNHHLHTSRKTLPHNCHSQFCLRTGSRYLTIVSRQTLFRPELCSTTSRCLHSSGLCCQNDQPPPISPLIKTVCVDT